MLQYQISRKSVQAEPTYSVRMDGQTDRRTDGHDEANSRFSQICESAKKKATKSELSS
jgi:hypothetical protein